MAIFFFLAGAAFICYMFFGYPLLLFVLAKLRPKPIRREPFEPTVSVLIPARNGDRYLQAKLESIFALNYPREKMQVIVVSDGSTDRTAEIARSFAGVELLESNDNRGKGHALNKGMAIARNEVLFLTDVRQPVDRECLRNLVAPLSDPSIGVVSGELVILRGERQEHMQIGMYVRYEEWLRKQISKVGSVPGATGAVYVIRRKAATQLPHDILLDDVYLPIHAYFQGYRSILEGSAIAYDYPTLIGAEFKRKTRTLAGIFQIVSFFPGLLDPRRDIFIHFLSHKLGRLLLPYAFLAVALATFGLPDPWRLLAAVGQVAFYGLALLDGALPEGFPLKRLSSLIRTFVMLLAAAVAATSILFRPARELWTERR